MNQDQSKRIAQIEALLDLLTREVNDIKTAAWRQANKPAFKIGDQVMGERPRKYARNTYQITEFNQPAPDGNGGFEFTYDIMHLGTGEISEAVRQSELQATRVSRNKQRRSLVPVVEANKPRTKRKYRRRTQKEGFQVVSTDAKAPQPRRRGRPRKNSTTDPNQQTIL